MIRYILITAAISLLAASGVWMDKKSKPIVNHHNVILDTNLVHASGRVEGATRDVQLRFEVAGRIAEISVREGDFVTKGTTLMRLDAGDGEQRVALKQAEWKLADAQLSRLKNGAHEQERLEALAIWESHKVELKRAQQSLERNVNIRDKERSAISQQQIENQQGEVDALTYKVAAAKARLDLLNSPAREDEILMAQARCDAAAAQLKLAQTELAKSSLVAPSDGMVAKLGHEPGELTGPETTEPAIILIDVRQIRVRAFIEEQDASRVCVGQTAEIQSEGSSEPLVSGRISDIAPRMSRKQAWSDQADERFDMKTREVLIEVADHRQLIPGLSVDVSIRCPNSMKQSPIEIVHHEQSTTEIKQAD